MHEHFIPKQLKRERKGAQVTRDLHELFQDVDLTKNLYEAMWSSCQIVELALYSRRGEKRGEYKKKLLMEFFVARCPSVPKDTISSMIDSICERIPHPSLFMRCRRFASKFLHRVPPK